MVEMVPVLTGCIMVYFQLEHLMLNQETYLYTFKNRLNMCYKHTLTWTTDKQACALTVTQLASTAPLCPCAVLRHCRWFPQWASRQSPGMATPLLTSNILFLFSASLLSTDGRGYLSPLMIVPNLIWWPGWAADVLAQTSRWVQTGLKSRLKTLSHPTQPLHPCFFHSSHTNTVPQVPSFIFGISLHAPRFIQSFILLCAEDLRNSCE